MYEQILPDLHRIEVPLPNTPLKAINCYLLHGNDRWLLIDTGMHRRVCRETLEKSLQELRVDLNKTDFFITHLHSDHIGQLDYFATESSNVYFNRIEAPTVTEAKESGGFGEYIMKLGRMTGFSERELNESLANHPGGEWNGPPHVDFELLDEGDTLAFGEFSFEVIHTPGHSPGHLCLYDAERRLMVAGDHVLAEISPNISPWGYDDDPLTDFLNSLEKVRRYDVELALPGHRRLITDWTGRIDELKRHHDRRLDEIVDAVNGTAMTPYQIASHMTWDMRYDRWEDVNVMQKWFAAGEATAHLRHLEARGAVISAVENGVLQYWAG